MNALTVLSLAALEQVSRRDFPDYVHLAPTVTGPEHPCAHRGGGHVTEPQCVATVISAATKAFRRCLACPQGQRLAATSPFHRRSRPVYASSPQPRPDLPAEDPALANLARELRTLTQDGRVRVSVLDLQRAIGSATYDDTMRLVRQAGLNTGRPFGSVPAIAVDHSFRTFLGRSEEAAA